MSGISSRKILRRLISPNLSLSHRVFSGGFWIFGLKGAQSTLNVIRLLVLARILAPNDFGLMGIALLTVAALEVFSQTGFQPALIQKKEGIRPYLNAAWTLLAIRAAALFAILLIAAPYAASFFKSPEAERVIQVMGVSILFAGFSNIGVVFFKKELQFKKDSTYQIAGTLADFAVAITSVVILQNVWALVFGHIAGNATRFVMSYVLHPFRPRLDFNLSKMKELWGFGRWITGSGIMAFSITQGVDTFVGRLLGAVSLGLYQLANHISNLPSVILTSAVSEVTFPAYSKLQSNSALLGEAYMRTLEVTSLLIFPISGLILVSAEDFTHVILGEKWIGIVEPMRVLALCGLVSALAGLNSAILLAVKRPEVITKLTIIKFAIIVVLIYPVTQEWGLSGTALVVLISSLLITPNTYYIVAKEILGRKALSMLKCIALPSIGTVIMCIFVDVLLTQDTSLFVLLASIMAGMVVYIGMTLLLERITGLRTWSNIAEVMRNLSK